MVKRLIFIIAIFIMNISFAYASSPYGTNYGFNGAPDLGPCFTKDQVRQKVTFNWCLNRTDGLIQGMLIKGYIDQQGAKLLNRYKKEIANQLFGNYISGNIIAKKSPKGSVWAAISSGVGWTYDRVWVDETPLDYWQNIVVLQTGKDKLILSVGLFMVCGNEGLEGFKTIIVEEEHHPIAVPQETPQEQVKERPLFHASRQAEGSTNSFTTYSNIGFAPTPNQTINLKNDNSSRSSSCASAESYANIVNDITMIQQMLNLTLKFES